MRASCQPASGVHSTVNMWSVKCSPKPGLARTSARRASSTGVGETVGLICMGLTGGDLSNGQEGGGEGARRGSLVDLSLHLSRVATLAKCSDHRTSGDRDAGSARYSRGDRVADLGGTAGGSGGAGGEVGDDGLLDDGGGVGVAEVVEQQRRREGRGGGGGPLRGGGVRGPAR